MRDIAMHHKPANPLKHLLYVVFIVGAVLPGVGMADDGSLRDLFRQTSPAVCVLMTVGQEISAGKEKKLVSAMGLGSGVLISNDGKVMTAAHVVHLADVVAATFPNGEKIMAKVIGSVPHADIALLQLEKAPTGIEPAKLGDSSQMATGDRVMIIGSPFGISQTLSVGYLSGRYDMSEKLDAVEEVVVFQSDAAANTGNSGGPMFNLQGEVIGIVSAILTRSGGFDGISIAITSNTARRLLLEERSLWSGVEAILLERYAAAFNIPQKAGLLVQRVAQGSLADQLGLKGGNKTIKIEGKEVLVGGDIILEVAGVTVTPDENLMLKIRDKARSLSSGEPIEVKVLRAGKMLNLSTSLP